LPANTAVSTLVRIGINRIAKDVTPTLRKYLKDDDCEAPHGAA
jgi:hypothetical protein